MDSSSTRHVRVGLMSNRLALCDHTWMHRWVGSSLVPIMAWRQTGPKQLLESVLHYCKLSPWEQPMRSWNAQHLNISRISKTNLKMYGQTTFTYLKTNASWTEFTGARYLSKLLWWPERPSVPFPDYICIVDLTGEVLRHSQQWSPSDWSDWKNMTRGALQLAPFIVSPYLFLKSHQIAILIIACKNIALL